MFFCQRGLVFTAFFGAENNIVWLAWRQGSLAAAARSGYITPAGRERSCRTFRPPQPGSDSCNLPPKHQHPWKHTDPQTTEKHNGMEELWACRETRGNIPLKMESNPLINGKSCCIDGHAAVYVCLHFGGKLQLGNRCVEASKACSCVIVEDLLSPCWISDCIWIVVCWQMRVETCSLREPLH